MVLERLELFLFTLEVGLELPPRLSFLMALRVTFSEATGGNNLLSRLADRVWLLLKFLVREQKADISKDSFDILPTDDYKADGKQR